MLIDSGTAITLLAGGRVGPRREAAALLLRGPRHRGGRGPDAGVEDHAGRSQRAGHPLAIEGREVVAALAAGLADIGDVLAEQEPRKLQREEGPTLVREHVLGARELAVEGDVEAGALGREAVAEADRELPQQVAADDAADLGRGRVRAGAPAKVEVRGGRVAHCSRSCPSGQPAA